MKNITIQFMVIASLIVILLIIWIWTRPNIYKPFSSHSAWEEGYKTSYGKYPNVNIHTK